MKNNFVRSPQVSTQEHVYQLLRTNIMDLSLAPGTSLSEKDIAEQLNVSRTPVREAFIRLSHESLVDILPQKGTNVSLISLDHVAESRFVRESLESSVVKLACVSFSKDHLFQLQTCLTMQELCIQEERYADFFIHDSNMHGVIFDGCNKGRTWSFIQQMATHFNRVRMMNIASGYELRILLEQHRELVRAIKEENISLGEEVLSVHLNKVNFDIHQLKKDFNHFFKPSRSFSLSSSTSESLHEQV